jgi:magnesium chelatase family protein
LLSTTESFALIGTEARLVQVEVDVDSGIPGFSIVGLPAKSVREAEQRTRSAINATEGERWPRERIVANLAPGALRKEGTHFDLPIALGVLAAKKRVSQDSLEGWMCLGELALDGEVRRVPGTLAAAIACRESGRRGVICPAPNAAEAALLEGIEVIPVTSLLDCLQFLRRGIRSEIVPLTKPETVHPIDDLSEVRGQEEAKRALEVAAAGGHNLLLEGPPGSGKTMVARRLPGILPAMSFQESLEVTRIRSVAGMLDEGAGLAVARPFRSPHHHVSLAGLVGGGSHIARPGEVSLAHLGVLFLDEITLYRREALESLRGPLEDGIVRIARSGGVISFPCRFSLIGAMNPCPCGFRGDESRSCSCTGPEVARYRSRLSGPLLDRFDMQVVMTRLTKKELLGPPEGEMSEVVRARVERARLMQEARYGSPVITNASASRGQLDATLALANDARLELSAAIDALSLSGRGVDRLLRVARTVADLASNNVITRTDLLKALGFRLLPAQDQVAA